MVLATCNPENVIALAQEYIGTMYLHIIPTIITVYSRLVGARVVVAQGVNYRYQPVIHSNVVRWYSCGGGKSSR